MSSGKHEYADNTKRAQRHRHRSLLLGVMGAFWGLFAFWRVAGSPRFETIHTLDVIGLMTAGAGLAVALVILLQFFFLPNPYSEDKKAFSSSEPGRRTAPDNPI